MKEIKVLLTGCSGLLGQYIIKEKPNNYFIYGCGRNSVSLLHGEKFNYLKMDITKSKEVKEVFDEVEPELVINCAAYTDVDGSEDNKEICWKTNVEGVENLIKYSKLKKSKLVQLSTDYIFDNTNSIYSEDDIGNPLSYYGKSKLAAENLVKSSSPGWIIARTSTLFDIDNLRRKENFASWLIDKLTAGEEVHIVTDQFGNPTLARNAAKALWNLIQINCMGVYNVCGREIVDRYRFAMSIAKKFNLSTKLIQPIPSEILNQKAVRPKEIGLDTIKYEDETGLKMMNVVESLDMYKKEYLIFNRIN